MVLTKISHTHWRGSTVFGDPLNLPLAPPIDQQFWLGLVAFEFVTAIQGKSIIRPRQQQQRTQRWCLFSPIIISENAFRSAGELLHTESGRWAKIGSIGK